MCVKVTGTYPKSLQSPLGRGRKAHCIPETRSSYRGHRFPAKERARSPARYQAESFEPKVPRTAPEKTRPFPAGCPTFAGGSPGRRLGKQPVLPSTALQARLSPQPSELHSEASAAATAGRAAAGYGGGVERGLLHRRMNSSPRKMLRCRRRRAPCGARGTRGGARCAGTWPARPCAAG